MILHWCIRYDNFLRCGSLEFPLSIRIDNLERLFILFTQIFFIEISDVVCVLLFVVFRTLFFRLYAYVVLFWIIVFKLFDFLFGNVGLLFEYISLFKTIIFLNISRLFRSWWSSLYRHSVINVDSILRIYIFLCLTKFIINLTMGSTFGYWS